MATEHLKGFAEDELGDLLDYYKAYAKDNNRSLAARREARIEAIHISDALGWTVWDAPPSPNQLIDNGFSKYL